MRKLLCSWCTKVSPGPLLHILSWKIAKTQSSHWLSTGDKSSVRNLLDLRDGNDDGVCDHDGHGSQLLLQRPGPDGSSPLGPQVSSNENSSNTQLMVIIDDPYFWFEILLRIICIFVHFSRGSCSLHQVCSWLLWKKMYDQIWLEPIYVKQF